MTSLLDVNVLLALGHAGHVHHERVARRIAPLARLSPSVAAARDLLAQLRSSTRPPIVRLTDDVGADSLPAWGGRLSRDQRRTPGRPGRTA